MPKFNRTHLEINQQRGRFIKELAALCLKYTGEVPMSTDLWFLINHSPLWTKEMTLDASPFLIDARLLILKYREEFMSKSSVIIYLENAFARVRAGEFKKAGEVKNG